MADVISDSSRKANKELHEKFENFGSRPDAGGVLGRLPIAVDKLANDYSVKSILDYGTGKGNVVKMLRETVSNNIQVDGYDPAVDEWALKPSSKYDIITCLDVLEHVELSSLDAVLTDINNLTKKFCFLFIDLQPAVKTLSDGRNAHVLLAPPDWWISKISTHFQCQISFPINHINGGTQKLLVSACQDAKYIPQMSLFISKLRLYDVKMMGGRLRAKSASN